MYPWYHYYIISIEKRHRDWYWYLKPWFPCMSIYVMHHSKLKTMSPNSKKMLTHFTMSIYASYVYVHHEPSDTILPTFAVNNILQNFEDT